MSELFESLAASAIELGAYKAAVIPASSVVTDPKFREMCASNACGMYGRCWTCPPDIGEVDELVSRISSYSYVLVYQTVYKLEDSFDFEGMTEAGKVHNGLTLKLVDTLADKPLSRVLHLGAGGCRICPSCAKANSEPCRFPGRALSSLEAYCISVSDLAACAGMKYINGQDTVTYFGGVFFDL